MPITLLAAIAFTFTAVGLPMGVATLDQYGPSGLVFIFVFPTIVLSLTLVGGFVAYRVPGNLIGWLLEVAGTAAAIGIFGGTYLNFDHARDAGRSWRRSRSRSLVSTRCSRASPRGRRWRSRHRPSSRLPRSNRSGRRIQMTVDRRFDRARYDGQRAVEAFASRLRGEVDLLAIERGALAMVNQTVRPAHAGLWLRRRSSL